MDPAMQAHMASMRGGMGGEESPFDRWLKCHIADIINQFNCNLATLMEKIFPPGMGLDKLDMGNPNGITARILRWLAGLKGNFQGQETGIHAAHFENGAWHAPSATPDMGHGGGSGISYDH